MKPLAATFALVVLSAVAPLPAKGADAKLTFAGWEKKVRDTVPDAERAGRIVEAGKRYDERRLTFLAAASKADALTKDAFLRWHGEQGERMRTLQEARDIRRKAAVGAIDAYLDVRGILSKSEWKTLSPMAISYDAPPAPGLAKKAEEAVPQVVAAPRLEQAKAAAKELAKAVSKVEGDRNMARRRLKSSLNEYTATRDRFLEVMTELEDKLIQLDDVVDAHAGGLQATMTPGEWQELVKRISP